MTKDDCGAKHLILAGVIVSIVLTFVGVGFALNRYSILDMDTRLRDAEIYNAGVKERLDSVQNSLNRIERDLAEHKAKTEGRTVLGNVVRKDS